MAARLSIHLAVVRVRSRGARAAAYAWVARPGADRVHFSARREVAHCVQSPVAQADPSASAALLAAAVALVDVGARRARGARRDQAVRRDLAASKYAGLPAAAAPHDRQDAPGLIGVRDRQDAPEAAPGAFARGGGDPDRPGPYLFPENAGLAPAKRWAPRRCRPSLCLPAQPSSPVAGVSIPRYVVSWPFSFLHAPNIATNGRFTRSASVVTRLGVKSVGDMTFRCCEVPNLACHWNNSFVRKADSEAC